MYICICMCVCTFVDVSMWTCVCVNVFVCMYTNKPFASVLPRWNINALTPQKTNEFSCKGCGWDLRQTGQVSHHAQAKCRSSEDTVFTHRSCHSRFWSSQRIGQ